MAMTLEILRITRLREDTINYPNLVFMFRAADVLDLDGARDLHAACVTLIEGGAKKILIDMEGLDFIDSSGIGALIGIAKLVRSRKGDIAIMRVPPQIELIFNPVNLQRFISFRESLEEAMNFFRFV
jgi:anti-sigma B factor antagonist